MLEILFSSKTRAGLLRLLLLHSDEKFYQKQIARLISQPVTAVNRELKKLDSIGALNKFPSSKITYYSINKNWVIYKQLRDIFLKFPDIQAGIKDALKDNADAAEFVFIYGSYADEKENKNSDLDIFVIGNISAKDLSAAFSPLKDGYFKEINYMLMTRNEFKQKLETSNHFVTELMKSKKIFLIGEENDFNKAFGC